MSIIKAEDEKKWITAFVTLGSVLIGYILIRFVAQLGEWFDLESKIRNFWAVSQGLGIVGGIATFIIVVKNEKAMLYIAEVYKELIKVIWPERESVVKLTIGLIIGLTIVSVLLMIVDYLSQGLLNIFYSL